MYSQNEIMPLKPKPMAKAQGVKQTTKVWPKFRGAMTGDAGGDGKGWLAMHKARNNIS